MALDIKSYLEQKLREYDPTIYVGPGSAIQDLLISPLTSILKPFYDVHKVFENRLSLADLNNLSEPAMDDIASNFGVTRIAGTNPTGYVRIYSRTPVNSIIPRNTEFSTRAGLKFYSVYEHSISTTQMLANSERYPLYHTGNILVRAAGPGKEYEIAPGAITSVYGLSFSYDSVSNPNAFTGGQARETNAELYQKIIDSIYKNSITSPKGVETLIKSNFGSVSDVLVIGAGNTLMQRDLVQDLNQPDVVSYYETDFRGKLLGQNISPYPRHRAYYGLFLDYVTTNSGYLPSEFPEPYMFNREFSQEDYSYIYEEDASITSIVPSKVLLFENFTASGYADAWVKSDEYLGSGIIFGPGEIETKNGKLYMGNDPERPNSPTMVLITEGVQLLISGMLDQLEELM